MKTSGLPTRFRSASFMVACAVFVLAGAASVCAQMMTFNSASPAENAATRDAWLAATGIATPQFIEDFEAYALDVNLHNMAINGGAVIRDTTLAGAVFVRGSSGFFGGSDPVGTRAAAHNEQQFLELDFSASPIDYLAFQDIDTSATTITVMFVDNTTASFTIETTGASGDTAEFVALYRNDQPQIRLVRLDASGDGEWGIDTIEYGGMPAPVPEPATLGLLGLALLPLGRRWMNSLSSRR
jgi:hypothetical protein